MTPHLKNDDSPGSESVIAANVLYHTALASTYDATQPHFRPENVARVDAILAGLSLRSGRRSLLDLGCGTGFIMGIAKNHFDRVVGVDLTPAMMAKVDRSTGNIEVYEADTAKLPFASESFDVCTAYSFLHHLFDPRPTIAEAYRSLRSGGVFFSDQDPNRAFWRLMQEVQKARRVDGVVAREVNSIFGVEDSIARETGLAPETVALAEFQKVMRGGLDPEETQADMYAAGFKKVEIRYEWYLGEGSILHGQGKGDAHIIDNYLRMMLPATHALFKYVSFYAVK